jgi:hypothetical protein
VTGKPRGILAIFNNVAAGREADFELWFQHEHLAERLGVPGFLLGRRYEATSGRLRYFNYYLAESAEVFGSEAYLGRLNDPTPMTRAVMSEIFKEMHRTVCDLVWQSGRVYGAAALVARLSDRPEMPRLSQVAEKLLKNPAVARVEIWSATQAALPVSQEERLRGGDRKIAGCLFVETLRLTDADQLAGTLALPNADLSTYRLLCDIRS